MKCGDCMDRMRNVLRKALRTLDCPLQRIAESADVARSTIHYLLNSSGGMRITTLRAVTRSTLIELEKERKIAQARADELARIVRELEAAFDDVIKDGGKK